MKRSKQHGYVKLDGFYEVVLVLSIIGAIALVGLTGWGLWWLIQHVRFV